MTITIIGIMAGIVMGVMQYARQAAFEAKTKAIIAKLNHVIMQRYESYMTRRVPVSTSGLTPRQAAEVRLAAIRYLMCWEMPERLADVNPDARTASPVTLPNGKSLPWPALAIMFGERFKIKQPDPNFAPAKLLYMIVASNPEDLEQFNQNEIAVLDADPTYPVFVDGWGKPIMYLRWAPGFSYGRGNPPSYNALSGIQSGDPDKDHDPFDPQRVDPGAFRMVPLIYSAGPDRTYSIELVETYRYMGNPYANMSIGSPVPENGKDGHADNITNHLIEQR